jgi:hypothetical protein
MQADRIAEPFVQQLGVGVLHRRADREYHVVQFGIGLRGPPAQVNGKEFHGSL